MSASNSQPVERKQPDPSQVFLVIGHPMDFSELGDWLVAERLAQGISQVELAERIGVFPSSLARMEKEQFQGVSLQRLALIMEVLGNPLQLIQKATPEEAALLSSPVPLRVHQPSQGLE